MTRKTEYRDKLERELKAWDAQTDKLKAQIDELSADVRKQYYKKLDELENRKEDVREQLKDLMKTGEENWEKLVARADRSRKDIAELFSNLTDKVRHREK